MSTFTVHPAADLFPMMSDDELQVLAASIAEHGQKLPIVIQNNVLIDGRNRLAACKLANVEPIFTELPADEDALAYIDLMDERRNVSKGQRAMVKAMRYPEAVNVGRAGRGKKNSPETGLFSKQRLSDARSVLRHSRSLALSVVNGSKPLDTALAEVKQAEQYLHGDEAKLARLRESAPDLAEQVSEERLKIDEAIAALSARQQRMREVSDGAKHAAREIGPVFMTSYFAIRAGLDQGDTVIVNPVFMKQMTDAMKLLIATQPKGESI